MRVVTYNILDGGVGRADPIGEVLEAQRADVVVLVEADDDFVIDRTARRLGMDVIVAPGRSHRVAILSNLPIVETINHFLIHSGSPRCMLEARLLTTDGSLLTVFALHLHARATIADETIRLAELEVVLRLTKSLRDAGTPHLIVGDFNADSPDQRIDVSRCKPSTQDAFVGNGNRIPRDVVSFMFQHGYVDTLAAVHGDRVGDMTSFTTHEPGQRVDYVFAHCINNIVDAWVETDRLATFASDHYPVGAELVV